MRTLAVPEDDIVTLLVAAKVYWQSIYLEPGHVAEADSIDGAIERTRALLAAPGVDGKPHPLMDCPACGKLRGLDHACETPAPEER